MSDVPVWIVALAFYAPFHYLGPVLVALLTGTETQLQHKRLIINILIDCTLSMLIAFALAVWLFKSDLQIAMLILIVSMCIPYLHVGIMRKYRTG